VKKFLRENSLGLLFGLLFVAALIVQAFVGHADFNERQLSEGLAPVTLGRYVTSSSFAVDVTENWQSEYLQFFLYIFLSAWLLQKGSPESTALDKAGLESDRDQLVGPHARADSPAWAGTGGVRQLFFSHSLGVVMGALFLLSWLAQAITGVAAYNEQQIANLQDPVSWSQYLLRPDFWNRTLQNWQSEFLAVTSMVVLSIYLRQRGSSQSKPVGAPHAATAVEG